MSEISKLFQQLEEQEELPPSAREEIVETVSLIRLIGDVADMFLAQSTQVILSVLDNGSEEDE